MVGYFLSYVSIFGFLFWAGGLDIKETGEENGSSMVIGLRLGVVAVALFYSWLTYFLVKRYHKSENTQVYQYGRLDYEEVYPKPLRTKLVYSHLFPWFYFAPAIVPIVTRLQHQLGGKWNLPLFRRNKGLKGESNQRVNQFELIQAFLSKNLTTDGKNRLAQLEVLKKLFDRQIAQVMVELQRVSITLSSLAVGTALAASLIDNPAKLFEGGGVIPVLIITLIIGLTSFLVFLLTQLQSQITARRVLSVVLDVVDVAISEQNV